MFEFKAPCDYLRYMYENTPGFISRNIFYKNAAGADIFQQQLQTNKKLIYKHKYYNVPQCYTSMNSFLTANSRKTENLKRLNALFSDIDCYAVGMSQAQVMHNLQQDYFNRRIPRPTFCINSGRGIYLIWKIDEDLLALSRWQRVQRYIKDALKEFGADAKAIDAARFLRVPFSWNSKSNSQVTIIDFYDMQYKLYDISKEYGIPNDYGYPKTKKHVWGEPTPKQIKLAIDLSRKKQLPLPDLSSYDSTAAFIAEHYEPAVADNRQSNVINGYLNETIRLITNREGVGFREYGLFLCRAWLCQQTDDFDLALTTTLKINQMLHKPLSEREVIHATKSAENKVYKFKKETLIRSLNITETEMQEQQLIYLADTTAKERKKERESENNKNKYTKRLEIAGEVPKTDKMETRREEIAEMLKQGKTQVEICDTLNISRRTYFRELKLIQDGN